MHGSRCSFQGSSTKHMCSDEFLLRIFIHHANMVDKKNNKQYKRNHTIIAQTKKTLEAHFKLATRLAHNTLGKEKSNYS